LIFTENRFSKKTEEECLAEFARLKREGKILSEFRDSSWQWCNGLRSETICFRFDESEYHTHAGKSIGLPARQVGKLLRFFALTLTDAFAFRGLYKIIHDIVRFLTRFGEPCYRAEGKEWITEFLEFLPLPKEQVRHITDGILCKKRPIVHQRKLSHLINYLAIDSELTDMYSADIGDDEFIKWFPVCFWAKVTFILPLRATEMTATPYDCLERRDGQVFLTVRRTLLKGRHAIAVTHSVDHDYGLFTYRIPEMPIVRYIEKYKKLTGDHKRDTLMDYDPLVQDLPFSLEQFNQLLAEFISSRLAGNRKYSFVRKVTGIVDFEPVTAGDSRPIAMANLFYQDVGADICRQLADHHELKTSFHYFTNVTETVLASSVIRYQRRINEGIAEAERQAGVHPAAADPRHGSCLSPYQPHKTGNIQDCLEEDSLEECLGCRYYAPSQEEMEEALSERRTALDKASAAILEILGKTDPDQWEDYQKSFLNAQTATVRFSQACDAKMEEDLKKWQRYQSSMTTYS